MSNKDEQPIISYKGFGADWKCRDFQYAVGGSYEHQGPAIACKSGFHACEYPLDVFNYYSPAGSRFAVVEQSGVLSRHDDDSKVSSSKITVKAEINFAEIIRAAIEYTTSRCKPVDPESPAISTGYRGASSATGDQGAARATGTRGAAISTGLHGASSATGYQGAASATGTRGAAISTGYQGASSATGDQGAASATGTRGAAISTGLHGASSATGDQGAASATGTRGAAISTGYQGASSATGYQGAASSTGRNSVAMASGYEGRVSGAAGAALFLVFRDGNYNIVHAKAAIVGRDGIKPDTFYMLSADGEFVEAVSQ